MSLLKIKEEKEMNKEEISTYDDTFKYRMLSRMKMDCDYYLGNGGRHAGHLWAGEEKAHIDNMKNLWESFSNDDKPEWLTWDEILEYENKMLKTEGEVM